MIKLIAAIAPREGWSCAERFIHDRERHALLTAAGANFTRHGVRNHQNHAIEPPADPGRLWAVFARALEDFGPRPRLIGPAT